MSDIWNALPRERWPFIRLQRLQSQAFVRSEALSVIPLRFNSKEQFRSDPGYSFERWADLDTLAAENWGALPERAKDLVSVDLDVDLKPVTGEWTSALIGQARSIVEIIIRAMQHMGVDCKYRYGRTSQAGWGHVYLSVATANKDEVLRLAALGMRRWVTLGELKLRVEVRLAPEQKSTRKPITLPGSSYPSRTKEGDFDPIIWQLQPPAEMLTDHLVIPRLAPLPLAKLIKGLYAGLLAAFLGPAWSGGARHETALHAAGVLAREAYDEASILDKADADAEAIMSYVCDAYSDDEKPDRMQTVRASLAAAEAGRPITGYTRLGEDIGEEAKLALLRLRGGDPDTLADLFDKVAYAAHAGGRDDVYLDLSTGGHGAIVCTEGAIIRHFHPHPLYKARENAKGKVFPLIEIVIRSARLRRYHNALRLPGVTFQTILVRESGRWREATEGEIGDPGVLKSINIGTGFATPFVDEPELPAWDRWWRLWKRHIKPLTGGDPAGTAKLEKTIAWAVQFPLEKVPLGLVLTGGGGIGKSVTFQTILPLILGIECFGIANVLALEGQYRLADLEGKKFYVVEEVNLSYANSTIKELFKDLMKNNQMKVNRKYGTEGDVENLAIPIFLTNEEDPKLHVQGRRERSLAVIQGDTREKLKLTTEGWQLFMNKISDNVKEFLEALRDPAVRDAAMYYFMTLDVERRDFEDNSDVGDLVDPRAALEPLDEAICQLIEQNELHPSFPHVLTAPFRSETLRSSIELAMHARGIRMKPTPHAITKKVNNLLGGPDKEPVLKKHFFYNKVEKKSQHIMYITIKYGTMIERIRSSLGFELTPAYELTDDDYGENPAPDPELCRTAHEFRPEKPFASFGRM